MIGVNHKEAKKRLQQVIADSKSKSLRAFALSVNIDPSLLAKVINGQRVITDSIANSITEKYRVNKNWLLYGSGEMYGQNETATKQATATHLTGPSPTLQDYIDEIKFHRDMLYNLLNSSLGRLYDNQLMAIAYQKAWVSYEAERASEGDPQKKAEIMYKMSTLVDEQLHGDISTGSQTGTGNDRKD